MLEQLSWANRREGKPGRPPQISAGQGAVGLVKKSAQLTEVAADLCVQGGKALVKAGLKPGTEHRPPLGRKVESIPLGSLLHATTEATRAAEESTGKTRRPAV
jgi:hypothetical protein